MAPKRMLIDALHPEETRVAVLDGNRLEDIDIEVASRKQLKGNIYLAKVTRVEPSLQAAFVDYGGNRHGFLAFNEIHPDYYQIPVADREALVAEHQADELADEADKSSDDKADSSGDNGGNGRHDVEVVGGDDSEEVEVRRPPQLRRNYKIQEVIKRRQILLVQVVKEERGNKGAAVTTYLSLAGRYCVLMPNTARGGGISRKIPAGKDRKRLKSVLSDLEIPEDMGVIVRTAGAERSKAEIRRDYDYLLRLWDNVRQLTLESIAPVLVYEEANLIKRSIRDLYNRDIEEVVVEGDEGYKIARDFMKLMIPSHVKRVKHYREEEMPLFHRYQVENQQDAMHSPTVRLKSGGYIVINPTEALVSIDVNSGRSTRERNIEETALRTNLEACDEVARQLRLRDLAGLVVIDFIDMEVSRNRTQVERRLKDAMRNDRARIQLGRISPFGLLELSRQRLRPSFLETNFQPCPHCNGTGMRRSVESTALHLLRIIEEEGIKRRSDEVTFHMASDAALYLLNHKRANLSAIESRYSVRIFLNADDELIPPDHRIERTKPRTADASDSALSAGTAQQGPDAEDDTDTDTGDEESPRKRRRRRSRRKKRSEDNEGAVAADSRNETLSEDADEADAEPQGEDAPAENGEDDDEKPAKRRRRGKRGGRRRRGNRGAEGDGETVTGETENGDEAAAGQPEEPGEPAKVVEVEIVAADADDAAAGEPVPAEQAEPVAEAPQAEAETAEETEKKPRRRRRTRKPKAEAEAESIDAEPTAAPAESRIEAETAPETAQVAGEVAAVEAATGGAPKDDANLAETPAPETPVAPVEPAPEPVPETVAETREPAADSQTMVIDVDSAETDGDKKPRRGWWRR